MDIHARVIAERAEVTSADARIVALEKALAAAHTQLAHVTRERDLLLASHARLREELELLKRRIFVAKAERVDTAQLEIEFADKLRQLDALAGTVADEGDDESDDDPKTKKKKKPLGRRNLKTLPLLEQRIEIADPLYEALVAQGKATRIAFEESCKLAYQRGGLRRLVLARVKYQVVGKDGQTAIDTAPVPPQAFPRSLAAPSLLAHIVMTKFGQGMPLFRIEDTFARDGCPVDRGTMCRWVEDAGATAGATVVHAAKQEALSTAFCIATDATGVLVQPVRTHEKVRRPCRRGHYFVHIADKDHVFFEYTPKETGKAVAAMFRGFSGYVQADAKSVYDVLFRDPKDRPPDLDDGAVRHEVACWAHCRRGFWEAAAAKNVIAREGLARIGRVFDLDASWRDQPPAEIQRRRHAHLRPHMTSFFDWAEAEFQNVRDQRGSLRSALGYAVRQKEALLRVLDDARLPLDNNRSERALRGTIATGRKAWLFVGSDDHAESAGHLFSLITSCRLHRLDPETYLRDFFRVLPHWPKDRYLELAPKYWAETRARLDERQLADEFGPLTVPEPLVPATEQKPAPNVAY
jgi:transposase